MRNVRRPSTAFLSSPTIPSAAPHRAPGLDPHNALDCLRASSVCRLTRTILIRSVSFSSPLYCQIYLGKACNTLGMRTFLLYRFSSREYSALTCSSSTLASASVRGVEDLADGVGAGEEGRRRRSTLLRMASWNWHSGRRASLGQRERARR